MEMRLATFEAPGQSEALSGTVQDGRVEAFGGADGVREALAAGRVPGPSGGAWPLDDVRLLAPIPAPGTIYGIGLNYADHIAEMGGAPPDAPIVFVKVRGSVAPPGGPIRCPEVVRRLDYEGELTIVIGAGGEIGGFCIADDVSARDLQGREPQWTRAKGADTFCPYGPWITTADEVPDPGDLALRTWVNGELRQDSRTSNLIFGCQELVEFISQTCTLLPGDLILTGTPNGVGQAQDPPRFLQSGDRVRVAIDGLGEIEHPVE
jgi:acylpyruvate hydrolase